MLKKTTEALMWSRRLSIIIKAQGKYMNLVGNQLLQQ